MRVEDLDAGRVREPFVGSQLEDLRAIGIDWDGEVVRQSERTGLYAAALGRLEAQGLVFRCFCSRREVREAASAQHGEAPEGFYPGTCLRADRGGGRRARRAPGEPSRSGCGPGAERGAASRIGSAASHRSRSTTSSLRRRRRRLRLQPRGRRRRRGAGSRGGGARRRPAATRPPGQALLCDLLGLPRPAWAHVPLVLGPDGARLAKRHGAVTLADLAGAGWSAADAVGWMARTLGLAEEDELVTAADLVDRFDPAALPTEPTAFAGG